MGKKLADEGDEVRIKGIWPYPLKFSLQNLRPQGRYRTVFGYHFVQNQDVGFYHPVRTPPGPVFVSILDDFGALISPSPDHSVGLFNDYKLDGFKWGIDNGQIWPLQSGWNQQIVKHIQSLGYFKY